MSRGRAHNLVPLVAMAGALLALALFASLHVSARAASAPAGTYVGSAACKGCHTQVAQGWPATAHGKVLADPQRPPQMRECEACHGPGSLHVQSAGKQPMRNPAKLKPADTTALCGACHFGGASTPASTLEAEAWKRSAHGRNEKSCTACHTLHGAGEHALAAPPAQLCTVCHSALTKAPAGGVVHAPVKAGQCLLCHDPHGSSGAHSLTSNVAATCESCHAPSDTLRAAHKGYDTAGADCTRCHDPHSFAADKHYLRPQQHAPFAQGNCQICHVTAPSTALKKSVADTCTTCHPKETVLAQTDAAGQPIHPHAPVAAGLCTSCHEPHASDAKATLLRDDAKDTCTTCHKSVRTALGASHQHPPVAAGDCLKCHDGHGTAQPALLHKEESALCQDCHKDQSMHTHPTGPNVKDPNTGRAVTCGSCHGLHGSDFPFILQQQETALCLTCHSMANSEH